MWIAFCFFNFYILSIFICIIIVLPQLVLWVCIQVKLWWFDFDSQAVCTDRTGGLLPYGKRSRLLPTSAHHTKTLPGKAPVLCRYGASFCPSLRASMHTGSQWQAKDCCAATVTRTFSQWYADGKGVGAGTRTRCAMAGRMVFTGTRAHLPRASKRGRLSEAAPSLAGGESAGYSSSG